MGSHSVTCHPTEVTFRPLPQQSWYSIKRPRRDARLSWPAGRNVVSFRRHEDDIGLLAVLYDVRIRSHVSHCLLVRSAMRSPWVWVWGGYGMEIPSSRQPCCLCPSLSANSHTYCYLVFHHPLTLSFEASLSANPSHCSPFFLVLKYLLRGFSGLFTVTSEHICFLLLVFFLFLHFLVVGSVR